jgi:hypothetical protein
MMMVSLTHDIVMMVKNVPDSRYRPNQMSPQLVHSSISSEVIVGRRELVLGLHDDGLDFISE